MLTKPALVSKNAPFFVSVSWAVLLTVQFVTESLIKIKLIFNYKSKSKEPKNNNKGYITATLFLLLYSNQIFSTGTESISLTADWAKTKSLYFGYAISTAGDINGDGYFDIIAADYDQIYAYYGSQSGLPASASWGVSINGSGTYPSLTTVGDVNGDGYSDVLIGMYNNNSGGGALVYYGSETGLNLSTWITPTLPNGAEFGWSVACAGDVNGDGYSDIIIGARKYTDGETNEGAAFLFLGSASGINTTAAWQAEGNQAEAFFGCSVATAGDVNGDGYSDVIIGASGYDGVLTNSGAAFIYHGSATGLSATPNWSKNCDDDESSFGLSVSTAGDVNGDGYSDVIIGAKDYNNVGAAWIYAGSISGVAATSAWQISGDVNDNVDMGLSVAAGGDLNADGYADVLISDPNFKIDDPGNPGSKIEVGKFYIFNGSSSWPSFTPGYSKTHENDNSDFGFRIGTAGDVNGDGITEMIVSAFRAHSVYLFNGSLNGLSETFITGSSNEKLGYDVASAGDVNGDGITDLIAGAPDHSNQKGKAIIYNGQFSGQSLVQSLELIGENDGDQFGYRVSEAGDVNGDGYCDVLVSAINYSGGAGKVYYFQGSSTGISTNSTWSNIGPAGSNFGCSISLAGDINGDGFSDIIIGADKFDNMRGKVFVYLGGSNGPAVNPDWEFTGENEGDHFGRSVASAGDADGDGYSDIIIGADGFSSSKGKIYTYYGKGEGLDNTAAWTIIGENNNDKYGISVASAGDVNRDGFADLIIGASGHSSNTGKAYLYLMSSQRTAPSSGWTKTGSGANSNFGFKAGCAGDINSDGFSDVIIGEFGYSSDKGKAYLYDGNAGGLSSSFSWADEGLNGGDLFGCSVSAAGDLNGDGYGDMVIGAEGVNSHDGRLYIYSGNEGNGRDRRVVQLSSSGSTLVGPGGFSGIVGGCRIGVMPKNIYGRADAKIEWELARSRVAFGSAQSIKGEQAAFSDLSFANTALIAEVSGLPTGYNYSWRVRAIYSLATSPFQQKSRWFYYTTHMPFACNGIKAQNEQLPVELNSFTASVSNNVVKFSWSTATESDNYGFEIEKKESEFSSKHLGWRKIGFVEGNGNSNSPKTYSFEDHNSGAGKVQYRLKQIDTDGKFDYSNIVEVELNPASFKLSQNYPNPFNPATIIKYSISPLQETHGNSSVRLSVYDVLGNLVAVLVDEKQPAGNYEVEFNASNLSSGVYYYRLKAGNLIQTKKMVFMK